LRDESGPTGRLSFDDDCVGTTEKVTAELRSFVDRGAELIILWFQDLSDVGTGRSQTERFIERVAPALRKVGV
jgi:hypothetical protein